MDGRAVCGAVDEGCGRHRGFWRRLVAPALLAVVLAGCTSGDGSAGKGEASSSPEAFSTDYRAVAQTFEAEVDRLRAEGKTVLGQGEDALLGFYEALAAATAKARTQYRSLHPPDDLAELHRRLVDLLERQAAALDAVIEGARGGATSLDGELQELGRLMTDWAQANREMSRRLTATS